MNSNIRPIKANEAFKNLHIGDISTDRSCILGLDDYLFIFQGSNNNYDSYNESKQNENGILWAELTAKRYKKLSKNTNFISLFVPNKESCMPDLYPLKLNFSPTLAWASLRQSLGSDTLFSDSLIAKSSKEIRDKEIPWRLVDSHWSEFGCLMTVNDILKRLGIKEIVPKITFTESRIMYGDLSQKFSSNLLTESIDRKLTIDLPKPTKKFDSGGQSPYEGKLGRKVIYENNDANVPLHLLIIGNSFSGIGDSSTYLTFWLSRIFKKTTFLHSPIIPSDAVEVYKPDILLFQGLERFLNKIPVDDIYSAHIEAQFFIK